MNVGTILTDMQITMWALDGGISPFVYDHINPASIDICLGKEWLDVEYIEDGYMLPGKLWKPSSSYDFRYRVMRALFPKRMIRNHRPSAVLAVSLEWIRIPNDMAAEVKLKTTPTRKGLGHPVADWVDPGFEGKLTLMLNAVRDIQLEPGQRICQLVLHKLSESVQVPYTAKGHYAGYQYPTPAYDEIPAWQTPKNNFRRKQ